MRQFIMTCFYNVTLTYFEGQAEQNPQAQRGSSRNQRQKKQVLIALVVTREGLPLGYEILTGNRHDSTIVQHSINKIEGHVALVRRT